MWSWTDSPLSLFALAHIAQTALLTFALVVCTRQVAAGMREAAGLWRTTRPATHGTLEGDSTPSPQPAPAPPSSSWEFPRPPETTPVFTEAERQRMEFLREYGQPSVEDPDPDEVMLAGLSDEELWALEQAQRDTGGARAGDVVTAFWSEQDEREAEMEDEARRERARLMRDRNAHWWRAR